MGNKLSTEEFISKAKNKHGDTYDYSLVKYTNSRSKVKIICKTHGVFEQIANGHLNGNSCPHCAHDSYRVSKDKFLSRCKHIHKNKYTYPDLNFKNVLEKIKIVCPKHGEFYQIAYHHYKGSGCQKCNSVILSSETNKKLLNKKWLSKQHQENKKTLNEIASELNCNSTTVGKYFKKHDIDVYHFFCSSYENELKTFLEENSISFEEQNRKIIKPYEIDIFIPKHNLAIEICGLYWHSEQQGKNKNYHKQKLDLCREKNITLLTIFEDELVHHKDIVLEKIKYFLFKSSKEKIYARNCNINILSQDEKSQFFNKTHIQGNGPGSISYGLEHKNKIVAAITFIKHKNGRYILNRYSTDGIVVGGFSKLLSHFKKNNDWREIVTFADLRWSDGRLYEQCGFILDKLLPPDYFYVNTVTINREHKFNFRHKYLKERLKTYDPALSERDNCNINGILRIWDCGKKRYIHRNECC